MPKNAKELLSMKEQIVRADKKKSELQGQIKESISRLKKDFACSSIKEGDKKLDSMKVTLEKKKVIFDKGIISLKEKMEEADDMGQ